MRTKKIKPDFNRERQTFTVHASPAGRASRFTVHRCLLILVAYLFISSSVIYAYCFPVPWAPEDGKQSTGTLQDGITFINLTPPCSVKIYTVTGELVRELDVSGIFTTVSWDGRDEDGEYAASGVYLWLVKPKTGSKTDKQTDTGKLIVIR